MSLRQSRAPLPRLACLLTLWLHLCCTARAAQRTPTPPTRPLRRQYDSVPVHLSEDEEGHAREFFKFVTRPDLDAPRWNITTYDREALAPGYWFTGFYEDMHNYKPQPWIGPHIYDQDGELVWSGTPMFGGYVVSDFRVSNVNGVDMLTGVWSEEEVNFVLDNTYEIHTQLKVGKEGFHQNIHDWNTAWNGTRALAIVSRAKEASKEESDSVGFHDGLCKVAWNGFEEYDTRSWEMTFNWNPENRIPLKDVFVGFSDCGRHWDYLHANSIDKFADGDFLFSGRYSDTLYKISAKDGAIVWKFNGRNVGSDFEFNDHFSGQHHARVHDENATHTIISLMDNAIRPGRPHITNDHSRGMVVSLATEEQPMRAELLRTYNHPQMDYSKGRGSMQILENDNAFAGWWWKSLQSEYARSGQLILEAETVPELKNYRSYKFPWIGRPKQPPDAVAVAYEGDTNVFVSWNGATEVHEWNVYSTNAGGGSRQLVASVLKEGFETAFAFSSSAPHIVVEAVDRSGEILGESKVVATMSVEEFERVTSMKLADKSFAHRIVRALMVFTDPVVACVCGMVMCATLFFVRWWIRSSRNGNGAGSWWRRAGRTPPEHRYERVFDAADAEEFSRDDVYLDEFEDGNENGPEVEGKSGSERGENQPDPT